MNRTIELKPINLKKLWGNTSSRKGCPTHVDITLDVTPQMTILLNVRTVIINPDNCIPLIDTPIMSDCIDIPDLKSNDTYQKLYELWAKYHNKSVHSGTPEQEITLQSAVANGILPYLSLHNLPIQKDYLESIGLLQDTLPDGTTYTYGVGYANGQKLSDEDSDAFQALFLL